VNILVIGNGAREHTLVWKLAQSPRTKKIFTAPGNAGTAMLGTNLNISVTDVEGIADAVKTHKINLVVVGPEAALAAGVVDKMQSIGVPAFGATKSAARIESSKVFSKDLMHKYNIPAADSIAFSSYDAAMKYIEKQRLPLVIKADGLAAGKGVVIAMTTPQARKAISDMMQSRVFGAAGDNIIVEECMVGPEMSIFGIADGKSIVPLVSACDYKRVHDNNEGPNTGGMGSYSPPAFATPELQDQVMQAVMLPTVKALAAEGAPYTGCLYGGLMLTKDGPRVLEFNARFGDPETQVVLPRLESDLVELMLAAINSTLDTVKVKLSPLACVGVVLASGGYPGEYKTGFPIHGLNDVDKDIMVFHAGTKLDNNCPVTNGGRVLTVVALGKTRDEARARVYDNISRIKFEGSFYRTDIADIK